MGLCATSEMQAKCVESFYVRSSLRINNSFLSFFADRKSLYAPLAW